jgi:hypothetical protein
MRPHVFFMKKRISARLFIYTSIGALQVVALGAFFFTSGLVPLASASMRMPFPALNASQGEHTSRNWAGYVATGASYSGVRATWSVPTVPAGVGTQADVTWVGIGGAKSKDLIQAGTQAITDSRGDMVYSAWYELLPQTSEQAVSLMVHPGDSITTSIDEQAQAQAQGQWLIEITDTTTGASFTKSVAYNSTLSSAEWIEEMPTGANGFIALDNFGQLTFSNASATANGTNESLAGTGAKAVAMVAHGTQTLATPSALSTDGTGFTVLRTNGTSATETPIAFHKHVWYSYIR